MKFIIYIIGIFFCLTGISCAHKKEYSHSKSGRYPDRNSIRNVESMENFAYKTSSILELVHYKIITSNLEKCPSISKWLDDKMYPPQVYTCDNKYVFIKARTKNPTGLETDFFRWLVIRFPSKDVAGEFVSLSGNINNIFRKNREIHIFSFDYGDDFFFKETFDTIPIKQREYILEDSLILIRTSGFLIRINETGK